MSVLVVDLARVMDESAEGKAGAKLLAGRWEAAKTEHAKLQATVEKSKGDALATARRTLVTFEKETLAAIEDERRKLRQTLLEKVRPVVAKIARDKKADAVVEASAALFIADKADITQAVLSALPR